MREYPNVLLDPSQVAICLIDHEPQMFFGVEGANRDAVLNGVVGLAKTATVFDIPIILSTVEANTFSGPLVSKVQQVHPTLTPIDRTTLNAWEAQNFKSAVEATGKKTLILAGLWTEVCVTLPALCAIADGYTVYFAADACAGSSKQAHEMAIQRMVAAGAIPITWQAALLEMQRDWADKTTYQPVMDIITANGGTYGLGVEYANAMIPKQS